MKKNTRINKITTICIIIVLGIILFCFIRYDIRCGYNFPARKFTDNGNMEPYAQEVPLHEMDFSVYMKYMPADALVGGGDEIAVLPCDVQYYVSKEDKEPAIVLKKGTKVCISFADRGLMIGYGLECWPDYQDEWRYGYPFIQDNISGIDSEAEMYYVKSSQLENVAGEFYKNNRKRLWNTCTPWDYPKVVTQIIDRMLYLNGAFCPERWKAWR